MNISRNILRTLAKVLLKLWTNFERRLWRVVRTAERIIGTTFPTLQELFQSEQNHSGPLTSSTLPLWTVAVWSTLQSSEHQNDQAQEQFLPSGNPSHEHLTLNVEHTLFIHLFI